MSTRHGFSRATLVATLTLFALFTSTLARAQVRPDPVARVNAAIQAADKVLTWISNQNDDCTVASAASVSGQQCGVVHDECTDAGWYSAFCEATRANGCGSANARSRANEGVLGAWSHLTLRVKVKAEANPGCDNSATALGRAKVDGTMRSRDTTTSTVATFGPVPVPAPDGYYARITVDTLLLVSRNGVVSSGTEWKMNLTVAGRVAWTGTARIDHAGRVQLAGLPGVGGVATLDPATGSWVYQVTGASFDVPLTWLATSKANSASDGLDIPVAGESELKASDAADGETCDDESEDPEEPGDPEEPTEPMDVMHAASPLRLAVGPNPLRGAAAVRFRLPRASSVDVDVIGVDGRRVAMVHRGAMDAGERLVRWDGSDLRGGRIPAGTYFVRVSAGGRTESRPIVILR